MRVKTPSYIAFVNISLFVPREDGNVIPCTSQALSWERIGAKWILSFSISLLGFGIKPIGAVLPNTVLTPSCLACVNDSLKRFPTLLKFAAFSAGVSGTFKPIASDTASSNAYNLSDPSVKSVVLRGELLQAFNSGRNVLAQ